MFKFIKSNNQLAILTLFVLAYIIYITTASFLRHDNFYTGRFDLGNMDQAVWNTTQGRIFQITDERGNENISRLSYHADFLLIFLAPLYWLWNDPKILLLVQTIVIAFGAYFVFLIAGIVLKNKNLSLVLGIAYLINPSVGFSNLYDFHAVTFATTFLLAAFYYTLKNKYLISIIFLILSGLTKENVWLITAIFGIYFFIRSKKLLGVSVLIISLINFYYLIYHAIPQTLGQQHFALSYYSDFGDSPTAIIKNVIFSPNKILDIVTQSNRLDYLRQIFLPLGFLSLFSPLYLLFTLSNLAINLLSGVDVMHQIYYQYTATITPFIFISAIYGIRFLTKVFKKIPIYFYSLYVLFFTLFSVYNWGPLPFSKKPNIDMFTRPQENKKEIAKYLVSIPEKYSVSSTNNLGSHLSQRSGIYNVPTNIEKSDYVMFLFNYQYENPTYAYERELMEKVKSDKNYNQIYKKGNFIVFRKNTVQ